MKTNHTGKTWHVNAILNNRIVGDETAAKFDKLHINGENRTIAVVYRPCDAREIVNNHNHHDELVEALKAVEAFWSEPPSGLGTNQARLVKLAQIREANRAVLAKIGSEDSNANTK